MRVLFFLHSPCRLSSLLDCKIGREEEREGDQDGVGGHVNKKWNHQQSHKAAVLAVSSVRCQELLLSFFFFSFPLAFAFSFFFPCEI